MENLFLTLNKLNKPQNKLFLIPEKQNTGKLKTPQTNPGTILVQKFFTQIWSRELAAKACWQNLHMDRSITQKIKKNIVKSDNFSVYEDVLDAFAVIFLDQICRKKFWT